MQSLIKFGIFSLVVITCMFFSVQILRILRVISNRISETIGANVNSTEIAVQRYIFTHSKSLIAKLYKSLNNQVICLGLKKLGVTPIGFLAYWCILAVPIALIAIWVTDIRIQFSFIVYIMIVVILLFVTSIRTASRIESREDKIMTSIDRIIPDIGNGVQNAINKYLDSFPVEVQSEFKSFMDRIVSKGMPFRESMIILSDSIGGSVFEDFAQKAIFYEESGDKDSIDIFTNIVELNRLRRDLRYTNKLAFDYLKSDFITASAVVWLYAFVFGMREAYTYNFMLKTTAGQILMIVDVLIEIFALAFITTIRAQEI